ncbi:MAG: hypothetical protein EAZ97_03245 [Bacteroidetes bacterium]|nr:MAG: hypothetical protein EAZ97_03245 [Bacteroidota bacterium]
MLILANALCDLANFFEINILKNQIIFKSKKSHTEDELQSIIRHFRFKGFTANIFAENKVMAGFILDVEPINAEVPSEKFNQNYQIVYPNLDLENIVYPKKAFDKTMKKGDIFIGKFIEHSVHHKTKYFIDDNNEYHSIAYAQIIKFNFLDVWVWKQNQKTIRTQPINLRF